MTDKPITIFETTLTWFDPADILPSKEAVILIKIKNVPKIVTQNWSHKYNFNLLWSDHKAGVERWAYFPEFEE